MKKFLFLLALFYPFYAGAATGHLEQYIKAGLKNNLALRQRQFQFDKSMQALKEAKGMFFPAVTLSARYTRAGGGRVIDIPIGDILNPLNRSLNQLYGFHGINASLPTDIPNQRFPFYREQEQETKLRLVQPIFQPGLIHNYKLKSNLKEMDKEGVDVYKRELISEIKSAYYTYIKTLRILDILDHTRILIDENLRISKKLVSNGKATTDIVYRAEADRADLDQKIAVAEKDRLIAGKYFNFLLNREPDARIITDMGKLEPPASSMEFENALAHAMRHREEVRQIALAVDASADRVSLVKSRSLPSISAVLDYGFWAEDYGFRRDDDFWMASLVLEWSLFTSGQNKAQKAQARLDKKSMEIKKKEMEKQIELQVRKEYETLKAARLAVTAAVRQEKSAQSNFDIVSKKYENGMTLQVVYIDARNTLTRAAVNHTIAVADYCIQLARFERAAALTDLSQYQIEP